MSEKKLEGIICDFVDAVEKKDLEKTLSFLAEDAVWVTPEGTFKDKEEVKRLSTWMTQAGRVKMRDARIGIMVKGNKAVYEYVLEGVTSEGMKYETLAICVYEFSGEKIQQHRALYDRLSVARQAVKGTVAQRVVSSFVKRWEKGLH